MYNAPQVVNYDQALVLSGLFRPLQAQRTRPHLSTAQAFGGLQLAWHAPVAPGVPEQTLLLALMWLATRSNLRLAATPQTPIGRQLRVALATKGELFAGETVSLQTTLSELARLCGYATCGGTNLQQVHRMLTCLAEITVSVNAKDSSRLLSIVTDQDGRTWIALNTRLAQAAWGERHVQISLTERHALTSQTAKALHAYLSGVIRPGHHWSFRLDRLEDAVWGERTSSSTQRSRRKKLREALTAIGNLGWHITEQNEVFRIARHSGNGNSA